MNNAVELHGEKIKKTIVSEKCNAYRIENETGHGVVTNYNVFPGAAVSYNDMHILKVKRTMDVYLLEMKGKAGRLDNFWKSTTAGRVGSSASLRMEPLYTWSRGTWL